MVCFGPLTGYYSAVLNASGKRSLVFDKRKSLSGIPIKLPCGQCSGCRLERARQWAMRCLHEVRFHDESCFVTLTYDDEELPDGCSLDPPALSAFAKRLHNRLLRSRGIGIRYYGCGEYGDVNLRPHYHILVFGWRPDDCVFFSRGKREGERYYTSAVLSELWPFGHSLLGDVTFDSACYVARYVMKKVTGDASDQHYAGRVPEFTVMSRRPGIGAAWYQKFGREAYAHDSVVVNAREVRPPRFYDLKRSVDDPSGFEKLKRRRRRRLCLQKVRDNGTSRRLRVRELVLHAKLRLSRKEL